MYIITEFGPSVYFGTSLECLRSKALSQSRGIMGDVGPDERAQLLPRHNNSGQSFWSPRSSSESPLSDSLNFAIPSARVEDSVGGVGVAEDSGADSSAAQSGRLDNARILRAIAILLIGTFTGNADGSLVLATHSTIASEFNRLKDSSWLFTAFALAGAASQSIVCFVFRLSECFRVIEG
jgi:hypothetical protein